MRIPDNYLDRLRNAGLVISEEPFVPDHVAYPNGHIVGKPRETLGNSIPEMEGYWGYTGIVLNAPTMYFYRARGKWVVAVEDWVPGPGPGDFVHADAGTDHAELWTDEGAMVLLVVPPEDYMPRP